MGGTHFRAQNRNAATSAKKKSQKSGKVKGMSSEMCGLMSLEFVGSVLEVVGMLVVCGYEFFFTEVLGSRTVHKKRELLRTGSGSDAESRGCGMSIRRNA